MSKVFVNIALSLDGYLAPEGMTMEDPGHMNWGEKWGTLMAWLLKQQYMREKLEFGPGGETGAVNDMVRHAFAICAAMKVGLVEVSKYDYQGTFLFRGTRLGS